MEIYLIRHTTPAVEKGVCYGQTNLSLTETFDAEAKQVLDCLPDNFDRVISSPLFRCAELAKKITSSFEQDKRLMEVNFGDWEMKEWNEIPQDQLQEWMENYVVTCPPNGESASQLLKRVKAFYEELIALKYETVALVTHLGVIRCIHSIFNKIELEESFRGFKLPYGQVHHLSL